MLEIKRLHWKNTEIYKNILGYRNNIFLDTLSKKNITDNETKFSLREKQRKCPIMFRPNRNQSYKDERSKAWFARGPVT